MQVTRLDPSHERRIVNAVRAATQGVREGLRRGVAALLAVIHPHASPRLTAGLDAALRDIDRIEAAKLARLTHGPS